MKTSFPFFVLLALAVPFAGCMTSRSRCEVVYASRGEELMSSADAHTSAKYRIREIRMDRCPSVEDDPVTMDVAGSYASIGRIMHTCPGVYENNGDEIFVDIVSCERKLRHCWTAIPCLLTLGICPYFQRDDVEVVAEVSRVANPVEKARFSCRFVDDWKISFLFQFGSIPYTEAPLKLYRIGKRGNGDVADEVRREGFAYGIAKALKEIESNRKAAEK